MDREKLKELIRTAPVLQETLDGLDAALAKMAPDVEALQARRADVVAKLDQIKNAERQLADMGSTRSVGVAEASTDEPSPVARPATATRSRKKKT